MPPSPPSWPGKRQIMSQRYLGEDEDAPVILEGVGWKRRSGFGKFSESVLGGSSWERRRFALTSSKLNYYAVSESSKTLLEEFPRGTLDILYERATITATYPSENTSQPTPYALKITVPDGKLSNSESTKWKLCFDDRETQLIWLVALTGIVAEASVKEWNTKILAAEADKSHHKGFHRLYEESDGRMLDLVHTALLMGGYKPGETQKEINAEDLGGGATDDTQLMSPSRSRMSTITTPPVSASSAADQKENNQLPVEKLYQAVAVLVVSLVYEGCAETSSSLLWQIVNVIILCICFSPTMKLGSKSAGANESDTKQTIQSSSSKNDDAERVSIELMKAERVPLSDMPSMRIPEPKPSSDDNGDAQQHRLEPLTEGEMGDHLHERWAMSSPNVDLSGEWTLIADDAFKQEYDAYLKQLGFNGITRKVACSLIARTTEITKQSDNGRELYLKGTNPKGAWERTLTASGYPDFETHPERKEGEDYSHMKKSIKTADSEDVDAEAWWEERGTKHRSWLRGGKKYGGGDFESIRYLEEGSDSNVLVCESIFHPKDDSKKKGVVNWRFQRDSDT
ncbi:hypothetical protein ACHAXR_004158 [Thalassiosira sp. AJA248-18]